MIYICHGNDDQYYGTGASLKEAFDSYVSDGGESAITDCDFYEGTKIAIEIKIEKRSIPVKKIGVSK